LIYRYFAPDTVYAKQNGGNYDFVVEPDKALPTSQQFWDDLMSDASEWGLVVYEQDWLDRTFLDMTSVLRYRTVLLSCCVRRQSWELKKFYSMRKCFTMLNEEVLIDVYYSVRLRRT
jgi:hypothetical protein